MLKVNLNELYKKLSDILSEVYEEINTDVNFSDLLDMVKEVVVDYHEKKSTVTEKTRQVKVLEG